MFQKYKILLGKTIEFAMQRQQANTIKCLIVIDKKDNFIGTLSDGDIRNAILKNKKLNNKIDSFVNRKSCFFYENNYQINELNDLKYGDTQNWQSFGHILLISSIEENFDIEFESEDISQLTSYKEGKNLLKKFNINMD